MNERCKDALYHSWGKAPERKKLEREYNRNYYNKNKHKWGVKSAQYPDSFVGPKPKPPTAGDYALNAVGVAAMMIPGGAYLFESPQQYAGYIKESIRTAKKFIKKLSSNDAHTTTSADEIIAAGKRFIENLSVVKKLKNFIKEGQQYMDEYY